jgi:CheY-like chemotaxis protein
MTSRARGPILIVEDNDETRDVLQRILSITGYWWQSASDGPEALAYLQDETKTKPAAIVLDIHMPGMDGREVMHTMQADPRLATIPVVIFTGDTGPMPDAAACIRKGSGDPDVLLAAIARCVER